MADKTIGQLPAASAINDASLIPIEQSGDAMSVTGALVKSYAQGAITGLTATATTLAAGSQAAVTKTVQDGALQLTFGIPRGDTGSNGDDGRGIVSITKTGTSGLVDTYTILYTDGTTSTYTVTNGEDGGGGASSDAVDFEGIELAYAYPSYTQNALDNSGNPTTGTAQLSNYLPVVGGETLTLSSTLTSKVAYYTENKTFISIASTSSGINDYLVPTDAAWARFQNVYSGGGAKPLFVRRKPQPENTSFVDLIMSPLVANPSICITGDSNTYGYGLSDRTTQAWSYLFLNTLAGMQTFTYGTQSRWCETIGALNYSNGFKFTTNGTLSTWADAASITLGIQTNYSSTWTWLIDGEEQSGYANVATLPLDGTLHKVGVKFTGGQAVDPYFQITKAISFVNKATSGVNIQNVQWESGHDWLIIMVGTNNRATTVFNVLRNGFFEYSGKGTFIVPFPNHKSDSSYTNSEMTTYSQVKQLFQNAMFEIVDCSDIAGNLFYDDSLYQSDLIHYNAEGHRKMANLISGRMGFPLYLKST